MELLSTIANAIGIGKWLNKILNPKPEIMFVNLSYPEESGLKADLEQENKEIRWCNENKVPIKMENEGYSKIFWHAKKGKPVILMVKTSRQTAALIQIKKRKNDKKRHKTYQSTLRPCLRHCSFLCIQ